MAFLFNKIKNMREAILGWKPGSVFIIAIIKRTDIEDKWDILISSDWIKESNNQEDLVEVITLLRDKFGTDLEFLSKIVLLRKDEILIKQLAKSITENSLKEGHVGELKISDNFTFAEINLVHLDLAGINTNDIATPARIDVKTEDF